ncbi:MAG TPA: amidase [Longimicrobiales bacterium]|nr:amidase [Longimicrobiales bacterium]
MNDEPVDTTDVTDADSRSRLDRREFVRVAVAAAASGTLGTTAVVAQGRGGAAGAPGGQQEAPPLRPLGNGEPPALVFQAYPGGTGAYMERLALERGREAFERTPIEVPSWNGPLPTADAEIAFLPVHRLAALIRARAISPVELTEIYLDRLKRYDPVLLCAVEILEDRARAEARESEAELSAGVYRGPLHGIPYGLKDLFAIRGARTTWGSGDFENRVIDYDSEVAVRLREAGAILVAKLATGLFAQGDNWYRGQTKNPWNLAQGSSGSSAGPASATAAGCVAFGIGTETQGSIVSPTIRCGLSALRPTFGRVSRHGGMVLAWSMDKVGPICRTIEDCALVFNAIHGADPKDPATLTSPFQWQRDAALSRFRIGYDERAPETFVETLRELGAAPVPMPDRPDSRGISQLGVESAAAFEEYVNSLPPEPDPEPADTAGGRGGRGGGGGSRGRFTRGRETSALEFLQSHRRRHLLMLEMAELMEDFDMYVAGGGDVGLTNQTGHPAAVLPYTFGGDEPHQPRCTTIIGNLFADDHILTVAHAYQRVTDWHTRQPTLP